MDNTSIHAPPPFINDDLADLTAALYVRCPTGLILPDHVAESRYCKNRPTAIGLFSGAGGFDLGFKQAGFDIIAAAEWDCAAAQTYMVNLCRYGQFTMHFVEPSDGDRMEKYLSKAYGKASVDKPFTVAGSGWIKHNPEVAGTKHFFLGDIRKLTGERILKATGYNKGEIDCVMGGPPCQGFSTAGKQNVMDPRNSLVFDFARLIVEINPKTFVFENVPGIINMTTPEGIPVLDAMGRIFEDGSFMTIDALKKLVAAQVGDVAGLRAGPRIDRSPRRQKSKSLASTLDHQADLFGDASSDDAFEGGDDDC